MTNLRRRLKKLEALVTDDAGLVPHSPQWLAYWIERIERMMSAQDAGGLRIPLEALDAITAGEATN
jgi:hypothetical protein